MRKKSRKILTGIGLVVLVLGAVYTVGLARSAARLRRAYAALEANGRPMDASEVIPPEVPDTQNAAVLYESAALMLKAQPAPQKNLLEYLGDLSRKLSRDSLAANEVTELKARMDQPVVAYALQAVLQAVKRPTCRFDRDYNGGMELEVPALPDARNLAFILGAKARFEARAGHMDAAWDTALAQLRFADSLRGDPTQTAQYTHFGITNHACRVIQWLCEMQPPEEEHYAILDDALRRVDDLEPLIRALDAERLLIGEWLFHLSRRELNRVLQEEMASKDNYMPEGIRAALYKLQFTVTAFRPRLIADHAAYLEMMNKRVQLLREPYQDRQAYGRNLAGSAWNLLTHRVALGSGFEKDIYCRSLVAPRLTRAGLALVRYRQVHGMLPKTLDRLTVEGLTDPFTNTPLHYRGENEGFIVYSVGEDQKDNGGRPMPKRDEIDPHRRPVEYDLAWRYPSRDAVTSGY